VINFYYRIFEYFEVGPGLTDITATVHGVNDALLLSINEQ